MQLDTDACYRAVTSRDRHFEGHFILGVTSTGLYCRPGCPARMPRRENMRFFPCAAAAAEAGYRPCARCRSDRSPQVRYAGTSATVARALRCIELGALDGDGDVERLGATLGVSARHLRRLFSEQLGASPLQVALTRRLHVARRLLEESGLSITDVAEASGFGSVRRFNDAVRGTFRRPPRELRCDGASSRATLALRLPAKPPLPWNELCGYLAARAIPGVEDVSGGVYRRTVRIGDATGIVEASVEAGAAVGPAVRLALHGLPPTAVLPAIARARRLFDLDADPGPIAALLGADPLLAPLVSAHPGQRVPGAWDGFEVAVRAILGQQVSVAAATTISGRLVARLGTPLPGGSRGALTHVFPLPSVVAGADLAGLGVPRSRAATVAALAGAVASGSIVLDGTMSADVVAARMAGIPGIGPWTIAYVAMRALDEPDAFPASDLGIRHAFAGLGITATTAQIDARAARWRPWRAYATLLLWSSLSAPVGRVLACPEPSRGVPHRALRARQRTKEKRR